MILKSIDNLLNKKVLCFKTNSLAEVNFSGLLYCDNEIINVEPILNNNMLDMDNSLFVLLNGNINENFIGKVFKKEKERM